MATQIIRTGGTVTVEIPEDLLRQANLSVGDPVEWTLTATGSLALRSPYDAGTVEAVDEADYEEWKMREIEAGFAEIDAGNYIDGEKVAEWVRSLTAGQRLPPPL